MAHGHSRNYTTLTDATFPVGRLFSSRFPQTALASSRIKAVGESILCRPRGFCHFVWLSCNKTATLRRFVVFYLKGRSPLSASEDSIRREQGAEFLPKFDSNGLLTAVAVEHGTGVLLMLAHMNAEAVAKTLETGFAHFYSRSRGRLWMKGESSGHVLKIVEIRVDCDQDALELRVEAAGPACHTMASSCFYRRITGEGGLERIAD